MLLATENSDFREDVEEKADTASSRENRVWRSMTKTRPHSIPSRMRRALGKMICLSKAVGLGSVCWIISLSE